MQQQSLWIFKDKATADKFIGKKMGDVVTVNTKDLFEDTSIDGVLKVDHDEVHTLEVDFHYRRNQHN
jgi:trigger factor